MTRNADLTIDLWTNAVPGEVAGHTVTERLLDDDGVQRVSHVVRPQLFVFNADPHAKAGGRTTVLILPGGGYSRLAMQHNGEHPVQGWLNSIGVHVAVLKYRLPSDEIMQDKSVGPLQDAQRAVRLVRQRAHEWSGQEAIVGIYGGSAGGHLAASVCTWFDERIYPLEANVPTARPDFAMLMCPVITMVDPLVHAGSRRALLGESPSSKQLDRFSVEKQVGPQTPPTILFHAIDDGSVSYQNSVLYLEALRRAGVPAESHFYERGGHGFKLGKAGESTLAWPTNAEAWMRMHDWV
ncbi:MAG TPA: alpha/beta hydrolase [Tepidisphaeraceae bacterium]|jgi:acetyl esterase/lipase|nr:alpha/beta hydrolase [Tepidisphaeraceae bacterium]